MMNDEPKKSRGRASRRWRFERRHEPLLPRTEYYRRLLGALSFGIAITIVALGVGTVGYCSFGRNVGFVDGLYNAAMILFGEGPALDPEQTTQQVKLFGTFYALFSGMAYITIVGVIFAPVFHRFLHRFHLDAEAAKQRSSKPPQTPKP